MKFSTVEAGAIILGVCSALGFGALAACSKQFASNEGPERSEFNALASKPEPLPQGVAIGRVPGGTIYRVSAPPYNVCYVLVADEFNSSAQGPRAMECF